MATDLFGQEVKGAVRRYPSQSREKQKEYKKRYCERHPERRLEAQRRWRKNHPEQAKAIAQAWRRRCGKESDRARRLRNFDKKNLRAQMLYNAKDRAKKRGLEFTISETDFVIPDVCPILGIKLKANRGRWGLDSPSLDRVDVSRGYVPGNVRVISFKANKFKSDFTVEEIASLARYVAEHIGKRRDEEERRKAQEAARGQA